MEDGKPTYVELERRLAEAEAVIEAIRSGEADAVVSGKRVMTLRLREAEEMLKTSEQRYRSFVHGNPNAVFCLDGFDRIVEANPAAEALVGASQGDLIGRTWTSICVAEDRTRMEAALAACRGGEAVRLEARVRGATGSLVYLDITGAVSMAPGEKDELLLVARDVTRFKRAEEDLRTHQAELETQNEELRVIQEELNEAKRRYEDLYEYAPVGYLTLDGDGVVSAANVTAEALFGVDRQALLGNRIEVLVAPEDRDACYLHLRRAASVDGSAVDELRLHRVDQTTFWGRLETVRSKASSEEGGAGHRMVVTDISARKQAEAAERQSQAQLQLVLANTRDGIHQLDLESRRYTFMSPSQADLTGYSIEELVGMSTWTASRRLHPDDRRRVEDYLKRVIGGEEVAEPMEYRWKVKSGEYRWFSDNRRLVRDQESKPAFLIGVSRDITRRKLAEQELRKSRRSMARQLAEINSIYDSAPVGLCVFDADLRFVRINERLAEINGVPVREHIGRTPSEVVPELADLAESTLREIVTTGEAVLNREISGTTPAHPGETRTWVEHWAPLTDDEGNIEAISVVVEDITERKRTENALMDLSERLEERVAERTAQVRSQAQQLRELAIQVSQTEQRERRRLAEVLHDHVQQLLVGAHMQLEVVRRAELGGRRKAAVETADRMLRESVDACRSLTVDLSPPVLQEQGLVAALEWLASRMEERDGFTVRLDLAAGSEPVSDDTRLVLFQSLRELLLNVQKHAEVTEANVGLVRTWDGDVALTVSDEGKGFEGDLLTRRREGEQTFGLFSIQQRVSHLGGRMEIESVPGEGARITLTVPDREAHK